MSPSHCLLNALHLEFFVLVGGAEKNRKYWRHFYTKKNMVVLVIDASNENTLSDSASLFRELLAEENLSGLPFIVVANKQVSVEVETKLKYELNKFNWKIFLETMIH